jgi:enamine deaminase RidA (YjgF/YER057c/UK114 family)
MTGLADRLSAAGLVLPEPQVPLASYVPARRHGDLVYLSGHVGRGPDGAVVSGVVGDDLDVAAAVLLARSIALDLLASAAAVLGGPDAITGVVRLTGYVRSAPAFTKQAAVINGASDLLNELFGDAGRHARSAIGVTELPLGAAVEIEAIVAVRA